jgi:hypothetical protein
VMTTRGSLDRGSTHVWRLRLGWVVVWECVCGTLIAVGVLVCGTSRSAWASCITSAATDASWDAAAFAVPAWTDWLYLSVETFFLVSARALDCIAFWALAISAGLCFIRTSVLSCT